MRTHMLTAHAHAYMRISIRKHACVHVRICERPNVYVNKYVYVYVCFYVYVFHIRIARASPARRVRSAIASIDTAAYVNYN